MRRDRVLFVEKRLGFADALLEFGQGLLLPAHGLPLLVQILLLSADLLLLLADLLLLFADGLLLLACGLLLLEEEFALPPEVVPLAHELLALPVGGSVLPLGTLVDGVEALLQGEVGAVVLHQGQSVQGFRLRHVGRNHRRPLDVISMPQSPHLLRLPGVRLLPLLGVPRLVLHHELLRHRRGQAHIRRVDWLRHFDSGVELLLPLHLRHAVRLHGQASRTCEHIHFYLNNCRIYLEVTL